MPTIKVNTGKIESYKGDLEDILKKVNSIKNEFVSISGNLEWDIKAELNINSRVSAINNELIAEANGISGMANFLDTAKRTYENLEIQNGAEKTFWDDVKEGFNDFKSELFMNGCVVPTLSSWVVSTKSLISDTDVLFDSNKDFIRKVVGFDSSLGDAAKTVGFVTKSYGAKFVDVFKDAVKSSTKELVTASGIISSAFTIISNSLENLYDDSMTRGRAIAETVMETVVDVGKDILIGAAVTAIAGGSAPVLAVAAGATLISVGADAVCKYVTRNLYDEEKDLTEVVSDFLLDEGKKDIENMYNAGSDIVKGASDIVHAVVGG